MESADPAAVREILNRVRSGGQDSRVEAAREIRRLTRISSVNRRLLSGAIEPLVSMLRSGAGECSEAAILALLNLAVQDERCANCPLLIRYFALSSRPGVFLQRFHSYVGFPPIPIKFC